MVVSFIFVPAHTLFRDHKLARSFLLFAMEIYENLLYFSFPKLSNE